MLLEGCLIQGECRDIYVIVSREAVKDAKADHAGCGFVGFKP
jgi:hypothetical protein